jgi:hypothetical protein
MGVLRYKLIRDIWNNKGRTLQVMLIIGIGSAAIGMIIGTRNLVVNGMQGIWQAMNPAMINLFIGPPVDEAELFELGQVDGVEEIEGYNTATIEWRLSPDERPHRLREPEHEPAGAGLWRVASRPAGSQRARSPGLRHPSQWCGLHPHRRARNRGQTGQR